MYTYREEHGVRYFEKTHAHCKTAGVLLVFTVLFTGD